MSISYKERSILTSLPWQLKREDLLFVRIPQGEKSPKTQGWNRVSVGLKFNDKILIQHLKASGNYGYYPAPHSPVLSLDVDDADIFHLAGGSQLVEGTFQYSAWDDHKKYRALLTCPDIPLEWCGHKTSITDGHKRSIVEIFFPANEEKAGGQCVAPGSLHPNGKRYTAIEPDAPIKSVLWADISKVINTISPPTIPSTIPKNISRSSNLPEKHTNLRKSGINKTLTEQYHLSVSDHYPDNPRICGNEVRGAHPIHGSTTGENVSVNPRNGTFYCFRCNRGGDAAIWDAICRGVISCDQAYDEQAFQKHADILHHEQPEVRYLERLAWKKDRRMRSAITV